MKKIVLMILVMLLIGVFCIGCKYYVMQGTIIRKEPIACEKNSCEHIVILSCENGHKYGIDDGGLYCGTEIGDKIRIYIKSALELQDEHGEFSNTTTYGSFEFGYVYKWERIKEREI